MTIPSVMQGLIELEGGKVFELDSPKGAMWLESIGSFRFEPTGDNKPYTVRKEAGKGGDYWYGYRKQNGKLHKKYIGKSSEVSTAKLEEIAEALNTPPQPQVTDKVTEVTDTREQVVTYKVTDGVTVEEFTALKSQVQALQESLEAIQEALPGKSDAGNFEELPTVTDSELQTRLGNLEIENQSLRQELEEVKADRAKLLENSLTLRTKLERQVAELRSKLDREEADREEAERKLEELQENSEIDFDFAGKAGELVSWLRKEVGKGLPKQVTLKAVQKILEGKDN